MKQFVFFLTCFLQLSLLAQDRNGEICAYWPLNNSFGAYGGESNEALDVKIDVLEGQSCALFNRPVDGLDHGLELTMTNERNVAISKANSVWMIFDFHVGEQFTQYSERIIQIGKDMNFMLRTSTNTPENGLIKLDYEAGREFGNLEVPANEWIRCTIVYHKLTNEFSIQLNALSGLVDFIDYADFETKDRVDFTEDICFGNKDIYAPDKFTGGIKNIMVGTGNGNYAYDASRSLAYIPNLPQFTVNEDGNLILSKINSSSYTVGGELSYGSNKVLSPSIVPLQNIEWIVQGNSAINDDYTFISKNSDSLIYDAWIDRGEWVTIQAKGKLPFTTGEIVKSNIIRHYVEENASRTNEIERENTAVIQENETLRFKHPSMAGTHCMVYNMNGQKQLIWDGNGALDISDLYDGAYVLRVIDKAGNHFSHKFIK